MQTRRLIGTVALLSILIVTPGKSAFGLCGAGTAGGNMDGYGGFVKLLDLMTSDLLKLLPRAMGSFVYNNRAEFQRGMTFMVRNIESNPLKSKDFEEVRRDSYERLMRDIPYCVEAFKGGEIKMDTSAGNLAGRLGMIAYAVLLQKMPTFPDLVYQERFCASFIGAIAEYQVDVWLFYDGYGDFHSLGELMARLQQEGMPSFRHVRNDQFAAKVKDDPYYMFRMPDQFDRNLVMTSVDVNDVYNATINDILDAYTYIWKCSGMDLAHPSYAAPPGTVISRTSRRMGGTVLGETEGRKTALPSAQLGGAASSEAGTSTMEPGQAPAPGPQTGGIPPIVVEGAATVHR